MKNALHHLLAWTGLSLNKGRATEMSDVATINIHAAKTQLSRLVELAASGQEIIIANAGRSPSLVR
jgi:hypothetical protein